MNKTMYRSLIFIVSSSFTINCSYAEKENSISSYELPPVSQSMPELGNDINSPITGGQNIPSIPEPNPPPSMEKMMAIRPGYSPKKEKPDGRDQVIKGAAIAYGARGGLAARNYAINEMLRRYEKTLDKVYDFRTLVLPVGNSETLIRPPVVTEADMSVALSLEGQDARETSLIYKINQQAKFVSVLPQWRNYLVRTINYPQTPNEIMRPRTPHEVNLWRTYIAKGWADGERQAVDIFLDDLSRLERDIVGMARYHILLQAGKISPPQITHNYQNVQGGHNMLRVSDTSIHIKSQPGLDANSAHWHMAGDQ